MASTHRTPLTVQPRTVRDCIGAATSAATSRPRGLARPTHSNLYIIVYKRVYRNLIPRCYPRARV
jgi:hypothetical protein